jgi:NAD(P)-dependent dehydrogenase (short-subunit alcohol dehydrogenase family)
MGRLDGKRAVVTGAASGIGEATARLFVAEGATVVLADTDQPRGQRISAELGERARFVGTDVSREQDVDQAVATSVEVFGGLDVMFNNAGVPGSSGGIEEIDVETWDRTIAVHLRGVFLGIRAAARIMRPQGHGETVLWLASDASGFVTGQAIAVDGGLLTGSLRRNAPMARGEVLELIRQAARQ